MLIEGKNAVESAIKSEKTFNKLYAEKNLQDRRSNEIITLARNKGIRVEFVDKKFLTSKSQTKNHQGFVAEITDFEYANIDDILEKANKKGEDAFIVILDNVTDPHNLGAIIRTCECAGVHGIILPKHNSCPVNETVFKTSAGAASEMLIARETNINQSIEYLKQNGIWIFALEAGGEPINKSNLKGKIALVMGGEDSGVSKLTIKNCDGVIGIPQRGNINSLNVSVAAGVAIYEVVRQRI